MAVLAFIVAMLSLGFFFLVLNFLTKLGMEGGVYEQIAKDMRGQFSGNLSGKERDRYVNTFLRAFTTLNIRPLTGICSDLWYHNVLNEINLLTRLGLRKEVGLKAGDLSAGTEAICTTAGNLLWAGHDIPGTLHLRYVDNTTDTTLEEQRYKNSSLVVSLTKNPLRQKPATQYCTGCGTEINATGETFTCAACGATYKSDSYDWVINQFSYNEVLQDSNSKLLGAATITCMVGTLGLGILSFLADWLAVLSFVFSALCAVAYVFYYFYAARSFAPLKQVQKLDPFCTLTRCSDRTLFLLSMLSNCRSTNRNMARQFMDAPAFEAWQAADSTPTGRHIVSLVPVLGSSFTSFSVDAARQHLVYKLRVMVRVFDERTRRMQTEKRTVNLGMYRNRNSVYQNQLTATSLTCAGCGSSVDLNAEGRCKYCGNEYDIADLDWKIEWLDNGLWV